jgi:hypothetical protein
MHPRCMAVAIPGHLTVHTSPPTTLIFLRVCRCVLLSVPLPCGSHCGDYFDRLLLPSGRAVGRGSILLLALSSPALSFLCRPHPIVRSASSPPRRGAVRQRRMGRWWAWTRAGRGLSSVPNPHLRRPLSSDGSAAVNTTFCSLWTGVLTSPPRRPTAPRRTPPLPTRSTPHARSTNKMPCCTAECHPVPLRNPIALSKLSS